MPNNPSPPVPKSDRRPSIFSEEELAEVPEEQRAAIERLGQLLDPENRLPVGHHLNELRGFGVKH